MTLVEEKGIRLRLTTDKVGHAFLHMDIDEWSASSYRALKKNVLKVLEFMKKSKHDLVFATTDDEKITKLWGRLVPLEELQTFGPHNEYWIGAWDTEEDQDGS